MGLHGGHLLGEALRAEGVSCVFTLCGNHTLHAYQGLKDVGIDLVDTRTEAGAAMAADAYARATRRPAVALVTGGPGHTNALTGLLTAHAAGSPIILLSGQVDLRLQGRGAQQELDQAASAAPMCKSSRVVDNVDDLGTLIHDAFNEAMTGWTGAVHLSLPADILADEPTSEAIQKARDVPASPTPASADEATVRKVLDLLHGAARPVIIAGTGAYMAACEDPLRQLIDASGIPLFTIDLARGMVDDELPGVFGYADRSLNPRAAMIQRADAVLLLGKKLDFRLRFGDQSAIDSDASVIDVHAVGAKPDSNRARDISVDVDVHAFVARLAELASQRSWQPWSDGLPTLATQPDDGPVAELGGASPAAFHPLEVARTLRAVLPEDAATVLDAGDFVQWCRSELPARGPGRWVRLGPMSTCGAGTPLAIGLKRAHPDTPVVLITGDGSFGYYLIEFEAALRQHIPFVAIVGHNSSWGLEYNLQRGLYGDEYTLASELSETRYDQVITALGGYGERITSLDDLGPALERALASGVPACIEVPVQRVPSALTQAVIERGGEV